ncbi:hypothetical protein KQX54_015743, partial [Cotesia glomerata]
FIMDNLMRHSSVQRDKTIDIEQQISNPIQWPAPEFCQILDLKSYHYDDVLRLIKHHFISNDPMFKAVDFSKDPVSVMNYLDFVRIWMKDSLSLVALSSKSGRIIGTIFQGEALEKVINLQNMIVKQINAYEKLGCDMTLRIYIICVHESYQSKGLESILLENCIRMAITSKILAVVGIFTYTDSQKLAEKYNFKVLNEIHYGRWIVDDEIVFINPGMGNYSVAFMGTLTFAVDYLIES